jgi:CubicO group peptidase (beta-lactamase class C family)
MPMTVRFTAPALVALTALLTTASSAGAQRHAAAVRPSPRTIAELELRVREVLTRTNTPGAGLAIVTRDSVVYAGGIGLADVERRRPATGATLFRIGSTSKAFTALAVLMLREEGKLRLDDPLRRHIPEIAFENRWESTDPVRLVHALEHTTGFDDWALKELASNDPTPLTLREGLDLRSPGSRVSRWRPGTRVAYSNSGPPLAGYVVERIEGKPFERVIQERLFGPLGMMTATFLYPDTARTPLATNYLSDGRRAAEYWHALQRPAGAANVSAEDMAQYVRFLLNRGAVGSRQLLPSAAIERLERSETSLGTRAGLPVGYGLHMSRYVDAGFVWTGHDGGVPGGLTNMAYLPEHGVGFALMINSDSRVAFTEISALLRDFVARGIARRAPPAPAPLPWVADAPLPWVAEVRYTGWYRPDNPRVQHVYFYERLVALTRVTVDGGALVVTPLLGGPTRYLPVSGLTFRGEREPVATLALIDDAANGRPVAIERMGYMLPTSLVHVATPVVLAELTLTVLWAVGALLTVLVAAVWLVRLALRRPGRSPAMAIWLAPIGSIISLVLAMSLVGRDLPGGLIALGRMGPAAVGTYLLLWLFAALAVAGVVMALHPRSRASHGHWRALSLWTGRAVSVLNVVAAAYLLYWGQIGWRTWA